MDEESNFYVELIGIGLPNRGAELLARAAIEATRAAFPGARFCTRQKMEKGERLALGIEAMAPSKKPLKRKLQTLFGRGQYVSDRSVRAVYDLSGFAYGDFWGAQKAANRLGSRLPEWRRRRVPLYVFPQAFGPFEQPGFQQGLRPALNYARRVYARDRESARYLSEQLAVSAPLCPDITLDFGRSEASTTVPANTCLFIPNAKLLTSGRIEADDYLACFRRWAGICEGKGFSPVFLCHEGERDLSLCGDIAGEEAWPILNPQSALKIKGIIKQASLVVSSRYHGLVTALHYGIPAYVLGWSHKYGELLDDFELSSFLHPDPGAEFDEQFQRVLEPESLEQAAAKIANALPPIRKQVAGMWEEVLADLKQQL